MLLDLPQRPTAVLCFSDAIALRLVAEARARGLRVPEDLSVVGFDDAPMASRMTPALTTVRQDGDAKGRAAAALTGQLAHRSDAPNVLLPTELVVRTSTCPPPPV